MELLLLLTAFLASLTGGGQADRAVRQVQGIAVVQAAAAAQAATQPARSAVPAVAVPKERIDRAMLPAVEARSLPTLHLPFERRLE